MKKYIAILLCFLSFMFVACNNGKNSDESSQKVSIKVGASPVPHARILENIKSDLAQNGINMEIVEFSDYVLPNIALNDGSIDANFFQHQPYLDKMIADKKLSIESIAKVHIEPIGFYSTKIKNIDELPNGAQIAIPNDPSNGGRALILLHDNGLIKLKDPTNLYATELDIVENPKKLQIKPLEAALIPKALDDLSGAVINTNYALQANLSAKDAIFLEDSRSPYANVLVVRSSDINNPSLLKLKEVLLSQKTKDFINEQYKGEIIPAF